MCLSAVSTSTSVHVTRRSARREHCMQSTVEAVDILARSPDWGRDEPRFCCFVSPITEASRLLAEMIVMFKLRHALGGRNHNHTYVCRSAMSQAHGPPSKPRRSRVLGNLYLQSQQRQTHLTSFPTGSGRKYLNCANICGKTSAVKIAAYVGSPTEYSQAAIPSWVASMEPTHIHLAFSTPNATGRDWRPISLSPSTLLKSFTMAMPRPAQEYKRVRIITCSEAVVSHECWERVGGSTFSRAWD